MEAINAEIGLTQLLRGDGDGSGHGEGVGKVDIANTAGNEKGNNGQHEHKEI